MKFILCTPLGRVLAIYVLSLFMLFGLRLALLVLYPEIFTNLTVVDVVAALFAGVRFDLAIITILNAVSVLALLLPLRLGRTAFWQGVWMFMAFVPFALLLVIGLASLAYFGEAGRHLSTEPLFMLDDWQLALDLMLSSRLELLLVTLLCLSACAWFWWAWVRAVLKLAPKPTFRVVTACVTFAVALPVLLLMGRGMIVQGKPINVIDAYALGSAEMAGLALNAGFSVLHTSRNVDQEFNPVLTYDEVAALRTRVGVNEPNPFIRHYHDEHATGRNIVVILLESWSNDYIDALAGQGLGATPNMDQLIGESLVFTQHYAAAQRSIQSIQAILTGVPVLPGQMRLSEGLERVDMSRIGSLAEDEGYRSLLVQSSSRRSFRMDSVAGSLGFQHYYGQEDIPLLLDYPQPTPRFGWDYDTLMFFKARLDLLAAAEDPFFGFVFTGTTHEPFADPGERFRLYPHDPATEKGYLNTLAYSDWALGEFFRQARTTDWYENTVFVITSDHVLRSEGKSVQSSFRVPLLIHAPGLVEPGVSEKMVSHYDLLPTLLDWMGVDQPFVAFGESLLRDDHPDEAWVNQGEQLGILKGNGKLLFTPRSLNLLEVSGLSEATGESTWARAQLLSHLSSYKLMKNTWMLGAGD